MTMETSALTAIVAVLNLVLVELNEAIFPVF